MVDDDVLILLHAKIDIFKQFSMIRCVDFWAKNKKRLIL